MSLKVFLPPAVELVEGQVNWRGDLGAGESATIELAIRINSPGDWSVTAYGGGYDDTGLLVQNTSTVHMTSASNAARVAYDPVP